MPLIDFQSAFFDASISETRDVLNATATSSQFAGGQLAAGRWLLQVVPSDDTVFVWVKLGKHAANSGVVTATAAGGASQMPLCAKTLVAIEFNVNNNFNDAAPAVICSTGTATCFLSRVTS